MAYDVLYFPAILSSKFNFWKTISYVWTNTYSSFTERKRFGDDDDSAERSTEEHWNLRDVIFVEDVRNVPVGKVLKVNSYFSFISSGRKGLILSLKKH